MKLNRFIVALTALIVLLTLFLRGYYRVKFAKEEVETARKELIRTAEKRYESIDSMVSYYRKKFAGESPFIERLDSSLIEFHREKDVKYIPTIENYIFNLKEFLDRVEAEDERIDSLRLYVYRTEKFDTSMHKAISRYNESVKKFEEVTRGQIYRPFRRFMVKREPQPIELEYRLEEDYLLPVETSAREEKEMILSSIVEEMLDTVPRDTIKKEGGESDKSDTAGVPTPGEGEGGNSGEEGDRTS